MPSIELTEEEMEIITRRRKEAAERLTKSEFAIEAMRAATGFSEWLLKEGRLPSYSAFTEEFCFQGKDRAKVYHYVMMIRDAMQLDVMGKQSVDSI